MVLEGTIREAHMLQSHIHVLIFTLFSCKSNTENMVIVIGLSRFDKFSVSCIPYARQLQNLDAKHKMLKSPQDLLLDHHLHKGMAELGHQMSDKRMCNEGTKESKYKTRMTMTVIQTMVISTFITLRCMVTNSRFLQYCYCTTIEDVSASRPGHSNDVHT